MAVSMDTGVPWVMCQQADAPDPIVSLSFPLGSVINLLSSTFLFSYATVYRLTLAMDFTVISLHQMQIISLKCGLRTGVDGKLPC